MQTFTIRDLRDRTADIVRDAEAGKLSVVTRHGQPVFVAVPFDEILLQEGMRVSLALKLFDDGAVSLRQGAKLAGMKLAEFMAECSARDVPVVRYPPEELDQEMAILDALPDRR
ncbi:MAG: type II toxin-antitoxin system prevent-host-death family antitoxin [Sulfuritalea sp.]|nr:type II toxin-antitoxin system prevent-host-death family antitoxin [Sulfuritalea sp.]